MKGFKTLVCFSLDKPTGVKNIIRYSKENVIKLKNILGENAYIYKSSINCINFRINNIESIKDLSKKIDFEIENSILFDYSIQSYTYTLLNFSQDDII